VRVAHGINAFAMVCMLMSGWAIYNASPIFAFSFPTWSTVGGWLGGSIAWHFAAMWLLVMNGLALRRLWIRQWALPARALANTQE
jgi:thiosulfate reductase cytochrome b subunit